MEEEAKIYLAGNPESYSFHIDKIAALAGHLERGGKDEAIIFIGETYTQKVKVLDEMKKVAESLGDYEKGLEGKCNQLMVLGGSGREIDRIQEMIAGIDERNPNSEELKEISALSKKVAQDIRQRASVLGKLKEVHSSVAEMSKPSGEGIVGGFIGSIKRGIDRLTGNVEQLNSDIESLEALYKGLSPEDMSTVIDGDGRTLSEYMERIIEDAKEVASGGRERGYRDGLYKAVENALTAPKESNPFGRDGIDKGATNHSQALKDAVAAANNIGSEVRVEGVDPDLDLPLSIKRAETPDSKERRGATIAT